MAVAHRGGPIRALDRHMPAFGDALSDAQLERAIKYLWTFCSDASWPRGDLNLPRALFTEKAFPENESVWTVGVTLGATSVSNELVYEHRLGARGAVRVKVPIAPCNRTQAGGAAVWATSKSQCDATFYAGFDARQHLRRRRGRDAPHRQRGPAASATASPSTSRLRCGARLSGTNGFLQVQPGFGIPSDQTEGDNEGFVRTALGYTLAQDQGFGRAWSPIVEVLAAKPGSAALPSGTSCRRCRSR